MAQKQLQNACAQLLIGGGGAQVCNRCGGHFATGCATQSAQHLLHRKPLCNWLVQTADRPQLRALLARSDGSGDSR